MTLKHVKYVTYDENEQCLDIRRLIEENGIVLDVRDIKKDPLTEVELNALVGHFEISHFLNPFSDSYTKNGFDKKIPDRAELVKAILKDYTLLRRPIIRTARLFTIGCNKQAIVDMLQLNRNGKNNESQENQFNQQQSRRAIAGSAKK
ncbi:MAG: arsenate reductase family protein [Candidatus Zixiibacteriota bacterium]